MARSLGVAVISVSESMATIAVYCCDRRHTLRSTQWLLDRTGQAIATLQRFRTRFDAAVTALSSMEVEDTVSVHDVVAVLQPGERMVRIGEEIEAYLLELGEDGRLVKLQREELLAGVEETLTLVARDYVVGATGRAPSDAVAAVHDGHHQFETANGSVAANARSDLHALGPDELLDASQVAGTLGLASDEVLLDGGLEARGYRLLHRLPRVSGTIIERIVERFATLPHIMQASLGDLEKVGGVGEAKARSVKDGLARLAEASILERYE
jgi:diadenylate cyclase